MNGRPYRSLSFVSALAAVLAVFISIRSCQVSNNALALASNEYIQERALILTANFSENNDGITLKPTNAEITLLKGVVTSRLKFMLKQFLSAQAESCGVCQS